MNCLHSRQFIWNVKIYFSMKIKKNNTSVVCCSCDWCFKGLYNYHHLLKFLLNWEYISPVDDIASPRPTVFLGSWQTNTGLKTKCKPSLFHERTGFCWSNWRSISPEKSLNVSGILNSTSSGVRSPTSQACLPASLVPAATADSELDQALGTTPRIWYVREWKWTRVSLDFGLFLE